MQERSILRKLNAGDPAGLEQLMDLYIPYVSAIVWNILHEAMPKEDCEEVVSEVFLAAWNQAEQLQAGHVKAWLGSVARHKAKNRLRQMGRTVPLEDSILELPGTDDPQSEVERREERAAVRRAVDSLPPEDREIFLRHYYYAQPVKIVSEVMGLPESTVKTRLRRGRMKLKECLTREGIV